MKTKATSPLFGKSAPPFSFELHQSSFSEKSGEFSASSSERSGRTAPPPLSCAPAFLFTHPFRGGYASALSSQSTHQPASTSTPTISCAPLAIKQSNNINCVRAQEMQLPEQLAEGNENEPGISSISKTLVQKQCEEIQNIPSQSTLQPASTSTPRTSFAPPPIQQNKNYNFILQQEIQFLEQLTEGMEYEPGMSSISKTLVQKQCKEIQNILASTEKKIVTLLNKLDSELKGLGEPVEDVGMCRSKIVQLVDACITRLQDEISGRIPLEYDDNSTCEGQSFDLCLTISNFQELLKSPNISPKYSETFMVGENGFNLCVKGELAQRLLENRFHAIAGHEYPGLAGGETEKNRDDATVVVSIFVENVELQKNNTSSESQNPTLLCSRFADLKEEFAKEVNTLYPNRYFLSTAFRNSLAREVAASRGGTRTPHLSSGVLLKLRGKLRDPINRFRRKVLTECSHSIESVVDSYVDRKMAPRFHRLFVEESKKLFEERAKELESYHEKLLEWEGTTATTNQDFMDTVRSIRSQVFGETNHAGGYPNNQENPSYIGDLNPSRIKDMSKEEQKLLDEQIEIFAYWKLLKKRLVDYVILSTHSELVTNPINIQLKPILLDAIFGKHDDEQLVQLMSAEDAIVEKRANALKRLEKLREALDEISAFRSKFM